MNQAELKNLNGEQMLHTVYVVRDGKVTGMCDQTITDVARLISQVEVVKITCQGYSLESKMRDVVRWGS